MAVVNDIKSRFNKGSPPTRGAAHNENQFIKKIENLYKHTNNITSTTVNININTHTQRGRSSQRRVH